MDCWLCIHHHCWHSRRSQQIALCLFTSQSDFTALHCVSCVPPWACIVHWFFTVCFLWPWKHIDSLYSSSNLVGCDGSWAFTIYLLSPLPFFSFFFLFFAEEVPRVREKFIGHPARSSHHQRITLSWHYANVPPPRHKPYANDKTPACPDKITAINLISTLLIIAMVKWGFPICLHVAANLFSFITAARAMYQIALVSRWRECWLWVKLPAPHSCASKTDLAVVWYRHTLQHMRISFVETSKSELVM